MYEIRNDTQNKNKISNFWRSIERCNDGDGGCGGGGVRLSNNPGCLYDERLCIVRSHQLNNIPFADVVCVYVCVRTFAKAITIIISQ